MSEKFTPGPWELGFEAEGDFDSDDSGRSVGWYTGGDVFSGEIVTARDENGEQDVIADNVLKRDAHLIAAAPDLYAALERIYGRLLMSDRDGDAHISEEDGAMAEAALRKARGEE